MRYRTGIDIGSTCSKTAVLDENGSVILRFIQPTGWSSVDTAEEIRSKLEQNGISNENSGIVATGYGRISVPFADRCVTEITCHAKGACHIFHADDLLVIDIGGQDTKLISVQDGCVKDFVMNDKCSAGTGRFLEVMSNTLAVKPEELCEMASKGGGVSISSMCTVFAESEVISLIGRGESRENIAFAVFDSIVKKVASQASRIQTVNTKVCLTGGLCDFSFLIERISAELSTDVISVPEARYAGAIGAALCAR